MNLKRRVAEAIRLSVKGLRTCKEGLSVHPFPNFPLRYFHVILSVAGHRVQARLRGLLVILRPALASIRRRTVTFLVTPPTVN